MTRTSFPRSVPVETPATRRRVLIVSHVFPPLIAGGAPRMGQFARMLPEYGWDVTVLTGRTAGGDSTDQAAADALATQATVIRTWSPSSKVVKRGSPSPKHGWRALARRGLRAAASSVLFPDREVFWAPAAIAAGRRALRSVPHDLVLATHGPATNLIVGRALARELQLPLVVDFRDLWSTLPMAAAFTTPLHRAAARRLETSVVRDASKILAVAPRMAESLASSHGISVDNAVSITNGFDPDDIQRVVDRRPEGARPFLLMYAGSVHAHYNLDPFWRVLRTLVDAGTITPSTFRVEFIGNLALDDVRRHGLDAFVGTRPFVPHERVFDELARADALLVVETPGYYAEFGYAAKVFDYVLTGKPVVGLVDTGGNTYRLLREASVGYCADAHDEDALRRRIEEVLAHKAAPPRPIDCDAEPFRDFNRQHLTARLASVLDEVVATEPRGHW